MSRQHSYCKAHIQRLRTARERPGFNEEKWRLMEKAVCTTSAAAQPPAAPPADAVTASGTRSIAIGGNNAGPLSTGDQPDSPRP
ncbi:hypothetical protein AB0G60_03655 [Streptomyces angustmyceticus]|uniref:Uncharacterized protein n=1 Tax=Streptomyces angustmyceticus TaxID=285578 RepID=A0A5J4L684_9ACTN|nr:hypothetical protein [Streptomyces angustmyceticus]UAL65747.1 hypothetical protein K7396_03615 [Streptomyces angustmyceticus]GES27712.1 hypothetical protein San01_01990 [Streptomyces angustmyceticus]